MAKAKLVHTILWRFIQVTYGVFLKIFFKLNITWHSKMPKSGFLLVANHSNKSDPFIIGAQSWIPINYMANVDGVTGAKKFFSNGIGCFNIKKGRADKNAFVKAMQLMKGGYTVGIFPEGDRSWTGRTQEFTSVTASLAKRMKYPIVMTRLTGSYMSRPRWNDQAGRRGKIYLDFKTILAEEIEVMSKQEIHDKMAKFLKNNDLTDERLKGVKFKGKDLAVGLENLLWKCPRCMKEDELWSEANSFNCKACGSSWQIDAQLHVIFEDTQTIEEQAIRNIIDWYDWQKLTIANTLEGREGVLLSDDGVEFIEENKNGWESMGTGKIELFRDKVQWKLSSDESVIYVFPINQIMNIVDNFNEFSIFNHSEGRFRIIFNKTKSLKWTNFVDYLLERDTAI